jgi:phage-related protein
VNASTQVRWCFLKTDQGLDGAYQIWYYLGMSEKPLLTVKFFKTLANNEPVREWLKSLPPNDRKTIGEDIKTVQYGWPIGMPIVEKIESGLWEVRTKDLSLGIARTFFTIQGNLMILLHGIIKKSQKIPQDDLNLARKRLAQLRGEE